MKPKHMMLLALASFVGLSACLFADTRETKEQQKAYVRYYANYYDNPPMTVDLALKGIDIEFDGVDFGFPFTIPEYTDVYLPVWVRCLGDEDDPQTRQNAKNSFAYAKKTLLAGRGANLNSKKIGSRDYLQLSTVRQKIDATLIKNWNCIYLGSERDD